VTAARTVKCICEAYAMLTFALDTCDDLLEALA